VNFLRFAQSFQHNTDGTGVKDQPGFAKVWRNFLIKADEIASISKRMWQFF